MSLRAHLISYLTIFPNGNINLGNDVVSSLTTPVPTANFQVTQTKKNYGTVSNDAGGTTVTGVNTQFLNTFKVRDSIKIPYGTGQTVTISAIASDTSMTTAAITNANAGVAYENISVSTRFQVKGRGDLTASKTIIAPGTTGSQTMDVVCGRINVAAAGTTVTVANSLVTANSIVVATCASPDATCYVKNVDASAAQFVINVVGATNETAINWFLLN
jgi:hypothetical protein